MHRITALTLAASLLSLSACAQDDLGDEQTIADESDLDIVEIPIDPGIFNGCLTATPDAIFYVASNSSNYLSSHSPSGAYGYSSDFCDRWVVDFKFAGYSPWLVLSGSAYDLPSSLTPYTTLPANSEDCARWRDYVSIYRKKSNESSFTLQKSGTIKGTWSYGHCNISVTGTGTSVEAGNTSGSGWDTYRVVVGTKERASWQQTQAYTGPIPPS